MTISIDHVDFYYVYLHTASSNTHVKASEVIQCCEILATAVSWEQRVAALHTEELTFSEWDSTLFSTGMCAASINLCLTDPTVISLVLRNVSRAGDLYTVCVEIQSWIRHDSFTSTEKKMFLDNILTKV
jgi:hypothetical protein